MLFFTLLKFFNVKSIVSKLNKKMITLTINHININILNKILINEDIEFGHLMKILTGYL